MSGDGEERMQEVGTEDTEPEAIPEAKVVVEVDEESKRKAEVEKEKANAAFKGKAQGLGLACLA